MKPMLTALPVLAILAGCDMATTPAGFPQAAALQGNTLTLDYGGRSCSVTAPQGTGTDDSFSIPMPAACPGVVEVAVARYRGQSAHVVQIVPAALRPLDARGQAAGITNIEVTVMVTGGAVAGYAGAPRQ